MQRDRFDVGSFLAPPPTLQLDGVALQVTAECLKWRFPARAGALEAAGSVVFAVTLLGPPGSGKSTLLRSPYFLRLLVDQVEAEQGIPNGRSGLLTGFVRQALKREVERDNPLFEPDGLLTRRDHRHLARWGRRRHQLVGTLSVADCNSGCPNSDLSDPTPDTKAPPPPRRRRSPR